MDGSTQKIDIDALKAQIDAEIAARPQVKSPVQSVDIEGLKAKVDAEIAARLLLEADYARYIHRRGVKAGGVRLLLSLDATSEVTEMPPLFRLPGAPAGVIGLANRHGRVVPVLDLAVLFGAQRDHSGKAWLIVCGRGEEAVGIVIDALPERKKFAKDDEVAVADVDHPIAAYAVAAYRDGNDVWIDIDTEAFFTSVFQVEAAAE